MKIPQTIVSKNIDSRQVCGTARTRCTIVKKNKNFLFIQRLAHLLLYVNIYSYVSFSFCRNDWMLATMTTVTTGLLSPNSYGLNPGTYAIIRKSRKFGLQWNALKIN